MFVWWAFALIHAINVNAGGYLFTPKPRSHHAFGYRSRLVNSFPCGGTAYNKPTPNINSVLSPNTNRNNQVTLRWFNTGIHVKGTVKFYLCTNTTLSANNPPNCYLLNPQQTATDPASTSVGKNEIDVQIPNALQQNGCRGGSSGDCLIVFELVLNKFETIYNCGEFYLQPNAQYSWAQMRPSPLVSNAKKGVPRETCCKSTRIRSSAGLNLAAVGDRCDQPDFRCGSGQCCTKFYETNTTDRFCSPIFLEPRLSQASALPIAKPGSALEEILNDTIIGNIFDPEVAQYAACSTLDSKMKVENDYRYSVCDSTMDAKEVCNLCNLPNPKECTSSRMYVDPEQLWPNGNLPSQSPSSPKQTDDTVPVVIMIVLLLVIMIGIAILTWYLFKSDNLVGPRGYFDFGAETTAGGSTPTSGVSRIIKKVKEKKRKLPKGWKEYETDDGEFYYYNEDDGTTQWEFPDA